MVIAEENLNVRNCLCAATYGPSYQATDDLAIFRGMPDLTIIDPCVALEKQGIPIGVVYSPMMKPLIEEALLREAGEALLYYQLVITAENHLNRGRSGESIVAL